LNIKNKIVLLSLGQPSTNPRLLKEALWFNERGYEVYVLYCFWSTWGYNADKYILANYPSIKWKEVGGNPYTKKLVYCFTRFRFKLFRIFAQQFPSSLFWAERSVCRCFNELNKSVSTIHASLYIAHNLGALPIIGKIATIFKKPFVFDAEDFHRGQSEIDSLNFSQSSLIENYWMPKASLISAASPFIANRYKQLLGIDSLVINNVFNIKNAPVIRPNSTPTIKLFWFSQTVGKGRGLEDILTALRRFPFESFSITIMGDLSNEMENYLRGLVLEKNEMKVDLHFLRPVEPDKIFDIASTFDVGLAIEPSINENNDLSFSNKLFTYLLSGNAILFTSTTAQAYFFNQHSNIGWIYPSRDIDRLVLVLEQIKLNPVELRSLKQNAQELATRVYNWEIEQNKLMNHLNLINTNA
jgi:glycosyltransferase involved in cell wall biosynthesis